MAKPATLERQCQTKVAKVLFFQTKNSIFQGRYSKLHVQLNLRAYLPPGLIDLVHCGIEKIQNARKTHEAFIVGIRQLPEQLLGDADPINLNSPKYDLENFVTADGNFDYTKWISTFAGDHEQKLTIRFIYSCMACLEDKCKVLWNEIIRREDCSVVTLTELARLFPPVMYWINEVDVLDNTTKFDIGLKCEALKILCVNPLVDPRGLKFFWDRIVDLHRCPFWDFVIPKLFDAEISPRMLDVLVPDMIPAEKLWEVVMKKDESFDLSKAIDNRGFFDDLVEGLFVEKKYSVATCKALLKRLVEVMCSPYEDSKVVHFNAFEILCANTDLVNCDVAKDVLCTIMRAKDFQLAVVAMKALCDRGVIDDFIFSEDGIEVVCAYYLDGDYDCLQRYFLFCLADGYNDRNWRYVKEYLRAKRLLCEYVSEAPDLRDNAVNFAFDLCEFLAMNGKHLLSGEIGSCPELEADFYHVFGYICQDVLNDCFREVKKLQTE